MKRLTKITQSYIKNSEKNQIFSIDKLDHKPTIHRSQQTHRKKKITSNRSLLTLHRRGYGVDVEDLLVDSPSGGAPEQAPRWDLTGTEACGGAIRFLAPYLVVWGYVGIYRRKKYVGGATWAPRGWRAHLRG